MSKLSEKEIINLIISKIGQNKQVGLGVDDVAVLPLPSSSTSSENKASSSQLLIFKSDMLVASTDVPPGMKPWQIARKSVVSCISDLSAKGVRPFAALISLGIPKNYSKYHIQGLATGFQIASKEFGVNIVGGDTNEASELVIDCSMIGIVSASPCNNGQSNPGILSTVPRRNGAKTGDILVVSGKFGYAPSGLRILLFKSAAALGYKRNSLRSVFMPCPRQKFGMLLSSLFSSSIDSSDGLARSIYELAQQSSVNFVIDRIPVSEGVRKFAKDNKLELYDLIFYGGEEYEIVATIPRSKIGKARTVAARSNIKLFEIGWAEKGEGVVYLINNGEPGKLKKKNDASKKRIPLLDKGYDHFR